MPRSTSPERTQLASLTVPASLFRASSTCGGTPLRFDLKNRRFISPEGGDPTWFTAPQLRFSQLPKSGTDMQFNGYGVAHLKAPPSPPALAVPFAASVYGTPSGHGSASSLVIKDRVGRPPPTKAKVNAAVERMRRKFDTPAGRATYSNRIGTVEPVFGNILNKGMRRS